MKIVFLVLAISVLALNSKTSFANSILLNEIVANPASGEKEWVEIYNSSSGNIDLNGWNLQEKTSSGNFNTYALPNVILQTKAMCFYEFSTAKLNNDSDTVNLLDNTGTLQDTYSYTSTAQGKSFARIPDGGNWNTDVIPTKASVCSSLIAPTTTSTPTPSPTPSSSNPQSSSFTISNVPPQINSDQSFNVSVNLSLPNNSNTDYYLSGAFKKADGTRYFGLTKINSSWIKYESANFLNQYKITTDDSGHWTGALEVKPDISDTDYKGSGDYIFKVGRYTSSGSGPTWSNDSTIQIISTGSDNQDSTPTNNSSVTDPTNSPTSVKAKATISTQNKNYDRLVYHTASVAGATASATSSANPSTEVEVKNQKQTSPIIWVGLIFIFAGASSLGYIYLRKNAKIHFPFGK